MLDDAQMHTRIAHEDGRTVVASTQDCEPLLERAATLRRERAYGSSDLRHVASFPQVLIEKYCNEHGIGFHEFMTDPAHIRRMLGDRDLSGFRIWPGSLGR